jgi:hypothetical protein
MNALKKVSYLLIALAMMLSMAAAAFEPASAAPEQEVVCTRWHTVKGGEYLIDIAKQYNISWRTLVEINKLKDPNLIRAGQELCVAATGLATVTPTPTPTSGQGGTVPSGVRVIASNVKEDKEVTLTGARLNTRTRYAVYLSRYGAEATRSYLVGTVLTDANGAFVATFALPKRLVDIAKIGITLKSSGGDVASNWFYNATSTTQTGGTTSPKFSFSVVGAKEGEWIRIRTTNLPVNVPIDVLMGPVGSKGIDGIYVGTLFDGDGVMVETFEIPEELAGRSKIDIRMENSKLGIAIFMTVENKTIR